MSEVIKYGLDYYYGKKSEQFSFYRIPKLLFTDESFKSVSSDAKILYDIIDNVYKQSDAYMSQKTYCMYGKAAINKLSTILWGFTSKDCLDIINRFV